MNAQQIAYILTIVANKGATANIRSAEVVSPPDFPKIFILRVTYIGGDIEYYDSNGAVMVANY